MGEPVKAEIILYQSEGANVPVYVRYMNETLWMPQGEIANLFGTSKQTISYHMGNIFGDGELDRESVERNFDNCLRHARQQLRRTARGLGDIRGFDDEREI